jgi:cell division septation protein DedD
VSELTHHDADDGFHEIQLSGKQLVALFMATTMVAVMIFLCGVQVGRGVRADRGLVADAGDSIGGAPPPASTPSQPAAASGPPAAEPPAPASEKEDELSYAKRLQADNPPAEKLKAPAPPAEAAAPKPETRAAPEPARPAPAASTARPGAWIVQVISLQDRTAASTIVKQLSGKGYPAFVVDPASGAPRLYRVQVGGYADRSEAEQAARRLERDEQFKPLVRAR